MPAQASVTLAHRTHKYDIPYTSTATWHDLKLAASQLVNIPLEYIKLTFRGREGRGDARLAECGVKPGAKVLVIERDEWRQLKVAAAEAAEKATAEDAAHQTAQQQQLAAVARVAADVDALQSQAQQLEASIAQHGTAQRGSDVTELQKISLLLERSMHALDALQLDGEARQARKTLLDRIETLCQHVDTIIEATKPPT